MFLENTFTAKALHSWSFTTQIRKSTVEFVNYLYLLHIRHDLLVLNFIIQSLLPHQYILIIEKDYKL